MRSIDYIRPRVGALSPTLRKARAWWVGTDVARDRIADHDRQHFEWKQAIGELASEYDCDPNNLWVARIWGEDLVSALTPNDPENLAKGVRLKDGQRNKAIPDRRSKAGQHLDDEMRRLRPPVLRNVIGGVSGSVDVDSGRNDGSFYSHHGQVIVPSEATHPVLVLPVEPDENIRRGPFQVDDDLWERIPLSILHALIEEQECRS